MARALNPDGETKGRARVGASALLLESRVSSLVRESRYRYPKVEVSPRQLAIGSAGEAVRSAEVDVALVHGEHWAQEALPGGIVVEELPGLEVAPVGVPATATAIERGSALGGLRVLAVDPDCASHRVLVCALKEHYGVEPQVIEAGSVGGARELVRSGYGIAMLPVESFRESQGEDGLAVITGLPRVRLPVHALWAGPERALSAVSAVCDVATRVGRQPAGQAA
ncbi:LysR family transcriptional regulator substrate-binding protein [Streptomyces sp. NPDC055186]